MSNITSGNMNNMSTWRHLSDQSVIGRQLTWDDYEQRLNALDKYIRECQPSGQNAHEDESYTSSKCAESLECSEDPLDDAKKQSLIPIPSDDATADQLTICWLTNDEYGQAAVTKSRMVQSYMQRQDENISAADRYQHAMALSLVSDGRSKVVGVQDWGLLSLGMRGPPAETDSESLTRLDAFNKAKEQELRDTIFIIDPLATSSSLPTTSGGHGIVQAQAPIDLSSMYRS